MVKRDKALKQLERDSFDVAVVGGGITGAGVALDAASRGYSVALVERDDFAAGTSSRSSKMVHGGLRYLENFDLGLVREALLERQLLAELAPHLVRPLAFVVPAFEGARKPFKIGVGLNLYDVLSSTRFGRSRKGRSGEIHPSRHRTIDGDEVNELIPALEGRRPSSGYLFYDCQTDDSRLVLSVLGEAERFGAVCANGVEVTELSGSSGRASGVICRERQSGGTFEIKAENIVNATGVWADRLRTEELMEQEELPRIRPSCGAHILISQEHIPMRCAAIVPAGAGRSIFSLPWLGMTLVGTTDNDYEGGLEHPKPDARDVSYLLEAVNAYFDLELGFEQVNGAYAGVRPLISSGDSKRSVDISRKAELFETSSGMITITGGKLTTYRRMAKMTVDRIVERDGSERSCITHELAIGRPVEPSKLPRVEGVTEEQYASLAARYGREAAEVLELAGTDPELAQPIASGFPDLVAEATFAARYEQAERVEDVLLRRTRLGLLAARELASEGCEPVKKVTKAMATELGWGRTQAKAQMKAWSQIAAAEGIVVGEDGAPK